MPKDFVCYVCCNVVPSNSRYYMLHIFSFFALLPSNIIIITFFSLLFLLYIYVLKSLKQNFELESNP